uniref:Caffeic acid O-methyltransferase n=1 Tax=Kalanchoe fedtschenkoi TaxID=63787 RepID=A0A7N0RAS8_KALFE
MTSSAPSSPSPAAQDDDVAYAAHLVNSVVLPMALNAAVELELFEVMARLDQGGGLTADVIAAELKTSNAEAPAMLDRILWLLASHDIVRCAATPGGGGARVYSLAPVCKCFVKNDKGVSFGPVLNLIQDRVFIDSWFHLKDAVLEGGVPFDRAHGMHAFEYPGKDQRFNQIFNEAMSNRTTIFMSSMLEGYKGFEHVSRVVDVGGGIGVSASMITAKYPHIKAINFDLPHVIQNAPSYPGEMSLPCNLKHFTKMQFS